MLCIEYCTAAKSSNLIIGQGSCALQMKNLNIKNIIQSAQIFCFTSDILNFRNRLTLLLKILRNCFACNKILNKQIEYCYIIN